MNIPPSRLLEGGITKVNLILTKCIRNQYDGVGVVVDGGGFSYMCPSTARTSLIKNGYLKYMDVKVKHNL